MISFFCFILSIFMIGVSSLLLAAICSTLTHLFWTVGCIQSCVFSYSVTSVCCRKMAWIFKIDSQWAFLHCLKKTLTPPSKKILNFLPGDLIWCRKTTQSIFCSRVTHIFDKVKKKMQLLKTEIGLGRKNIEGGESCQKSCNCAAFFFFQSMYLQLFRIQKKRGTIF